MEGDASDLPQDEVARGPDGRARGEGLAVGQLAVDVEARLAGDLRRRLTRSSLMDSDATH